MTPTPETLSPLCKSLFDYMSYLDYEGLNWDEKEALEALAPVIELEQARRRAEREGGWMKRVLRGIGWPSWMQWVEGPYYATGDFDELAFFRALKQRPTPIMPNAPLNAEPKPEVPGGPA